MAQFTDRLGLAPGRFRFLLGSLIVYLAFVTTAGGFLNDASLRLASSLVVIAGAFDLLRAAHRRVALVVVLATASVGSKLLSMLLAGKAEVLVANLTSAVFLLVIMGGLLVAIGNRQLVPGDRIVGAICAYLLIGLTWAHLFSSIEIATPGSFHLSQAQAYAGKSLAIEGQLTYFAFVTLTTLGFGDITPLTPMSRMATVIEAVASQLFIAITVARLVSAASPDKTNT